MMFTLFSYTVQWYTVNVNIVIIHSYTLYRQYLHCVSFHIYIIYFQF